MALGHTLFRVAVGGTVFAHGTQKLFGWFGGHGLEATAGAFDSMGLRPGKRTAVAAGASEAGGGLLLALGLLTPAASAAVIGVMSQAVRTVHLDKGFFFSDGGYEYNLILGASAFLLADAGPGPISLDEKLGIRLSGPAVALAALTAGLAGPKLLERLAPADEPEAAPQAPEQAPDAVQATAA
jgi:putative oxidoreductase